MKVAILGLGKQGLSAYNYWKKSGNQITICDENNQLNVPGDAERKLGSNYLENLDVFDLIVRSPSVHPKDIIKANSPQILDKVTTVTNEFFKVCPSQNIIGITGTKGKGTTSTLIAKILEASGKKVHLGGNIGVAPLDMLENNIGKDDYVVLELANFQLIDIAYSPKIGVCLMVVPEHLDWHDDVNEYVASKRQLFTHQKPEDIAIYLAENELSKKVVDVSKGKKIPYFAEPGAFVSGEKIIIDGNEICHINKVKLLGKHNWQNICAAITCTWQITQDVPAIQSVLTSFSGLAHRLELIRDLNGIKFYDDSFATTPESSIVAIEALKEPKVVILGGSTKNAPYDELAKTIKNSNVRQVVAIGETGPDIISSLNKAGFTAITPGGKSIEEIVSNAYKTAKTGDAVLLSPACASFDMFKNYTDRGEKFKVAVLALA